MALIDGELIKQMEIVERKQSEPVDDTMFVIKAAEKEGEQDVIDAEAKMKSRRLHWLLTSMISGEAAKVMQTGLQINGYETYRRLLTRYRIHVHSRTMGRLTRIIKPDGEASGQHRSMGG